ncbi:succinyldiaminopimelate transaminase [Demequina lignilytica]|uniref:Aminotransferase n=1 Tax=Demequina lignilytica TaxID=3051663 RepID=A0AB35MGQ8_9MICO|nr:succinyldiaminopimelate transaminase [Demequina sp. SYSU T0a273]MDN4482944.1 succinyldiaminopimelate transaminase [Demequina sp. SYSU T0a273]
MGLRPGSLPDFPWDSLAPYRARAAAHPDGLVDLSVGTPVDPTPAIVREALAAAADAPGYPTTHGTAALREAVAAWFARRRHAPGVDPAAVLPTVGSKELVAMLPAYLGLGEGDVVVHPRAAYPTYDVGARLAGATPLATDDVDDWRGDPSVRLVWVNSPSNPTGAVAGAAHLAEVVAAAREIGALVASDECYAELAWTPEPVPSILDPAVCGSSHEGVLAVYSLSKQSNLAGYRAAFAAGDPAVVAALLEVRKHAGMIMPAPVQAAMTVALGDDAHVAEQKERYRRRRDLLKPAVEAAGFRVEHSTAGLYLWATRDEDCWQTLDFLAEHGILAAPGAFYGEAARRHVRIALTASDSGVASASSRLANDR